MSTDNRPYVLWGKIDTKQTRNVLSIDAQREIAEYFIGRKAENIFFDEDTGPDLNACKNLWLAIEYAKANNFLLVIAKASSLRNIDEALLIVDSMGEQNIYFCDVPFMDRFALKCAFELFERQTLIKGIHTKKGLQRQQKSLKEKGYFVNKRGEAVTHLGNEKGCDMSKANAASVASKQANAKEWRENSPAWQWVKSQIVKGKSTAEILDGFLELAKHQPDVYCSRKGTPMTLPKLSQWKRQILEDSAMSTTPQTLNSQNVEDEFAIIERKSDAVEYSINVNPADTQRPAVPSVVINPKKLRIFEQQTKAAQELLSGIFVEEETATPQNTEPDNTTSAWMDVLKSLLTKEVWERAEVEEMCKEQELMLGAVLEQINDFAYEKVGDAVVEDDGENIYVTLDYKEQLI